jgi:hypothetical protein
MAAFKYRAFLSYSHRDTAWAKWLHRALEGYRIDKDLISRVTACGPIPKTLRPIFRDREDFSAGYSLSEQTVAALEASQFLVIICSPNAARSQYVNEEIRRFKVLGGGARVIPVIVDGEPGDPDYECFPPAIRFRLSADGALTDEREEPIAADARSQGDGREIATQKVAAGLLGLGLDEIVRRAERARKRRNRVRVVAAVVAVGVVGTAVLGLTGFDRSYQQLRVQEDLNSARDAADICGDSAKFLGQSQLPESKKMELALECVETFSQVLGTLPKGTDVPESVMSSFAVYLGALRQFRDEQKLSAEQIDILDKGETVAAQFGSG